MATEIIIDTSDMDTARIVLRHNGSEHEVVSQRKGLSSQVVLPLLSQTLTKHNIKVSDITHIIVATGPGSFTGLRVGIAIANALSYLLHIPVNKLPIGTFASAVYE